MKKLSFILLIFFLFSCNNNESSDKQSSDGKEGSTATFILKNNNMYVVDHSNLNVFSITNPENPVKVRTVEIGFDIETLFSSDNYLFIGSRNGMFIYSIAEPENPTFVSQALHLRACDPVVANSTNAFVTLHSNTVCGAANNVLMVYNMTDIKQPKLIAQRDLSEPKGLALNGNYLYICDKNDIVIFDITNPQNPSVVKTIANVPARDLIIDNNRLFAFTNSDVKQYSIDPTNIQNINLISSYTL